MERLVEMDGLKMISKPRKYRRGGGVCIIADITQVSITPLEVDTGNLEIVWALVKPLEDSIVKQIITFAFYMPPKSRMKSKMNDHIVTTLHQLLTVYPSAGIMGGGDRNDWSVQQILPAVPRFQNIQHLPTRNGKNLDIFLTNIGQYYSRPVVVPSVDPDCPAKGKRSDHDVPIIYPLDNFSITESKSYREKTTRPLPDSGVRSFGLAMMNQDWEEVRLEDSPTQQDDALQALLSNMLEASLPTKTVKLRYNDKPFITQEIKVIDRKRRREYDKHGKSQKYLALNTVYERKLKAAKKAYLNRNVRALMDTEPGRAYSILKRLGAQPGDTGDAGTFDIQEHVSLGLSPAESADRIAQKFAQISQEFPALKLEHMDIRVCHNIKNSETQPKPFISNSLVEKKIQKSKNTKGGVSGDLPVKLSKEFGSELAIPAARIFNNIVQTGKWPTRWKQEQGIPLNKSRPKQPQSESEIRVISLTPFLSKTFESIVMDWLLHYIGSKLDWSQYGGVKGSSTNHYLIDLITFILYNQDLKEPRAVLAAMIDFEKAFNRQNHYKLMAKLNDLGVPGWLLNIIKGFLEERTLIVNYKGQKSGSKDMPGGGPQGTILGMFLFLVLINDAGFPEENRKIGEKITQARNKRKSIDTKHWKYVDDLTIAESLDLKVKLKKAPENQLQRPLPFHSRTEHELPPAHSKVQEQIKEILEYSLKNEMKINKNKSKVMLFNTAKQRDFTPAVHIEDEAVEVVEQFKLLGVQITSDLRWNANTKYITTKAYQKLWMLRRLKANGANECELRDIYFKHVRSVLEYGAVVWHAALTQQNTTDIERVQKCALSIILAKDYVNYENALKILKVEKLKIRRETLCMKFARDAYKSEKFSSWFVPSRKLRFTRSQPSKVKPVNTRTSRFRKSALPHMTQLLNKSQPNGTP